MLDDDWKPKVLGESDGPSEMIVTGLGVDDEVGMGRDDSRVMLLSPSYGMICSCEGGKATTLRESHQCQQRSVHITIDTVQNSPA